MMRRDGMMLTWISSDSWNGGAMYAISLMFILLQVSTLSCVYIL